VEKDLSFLTLLVVLLLVHSLGAELVVFLVLEAVKRNKGNWFHEVLEIKQCFFNYISVQI